MAERIVVTLPDGSKREVPRGTTPAEVAASLGQRLAKEALVARWNGKLIDLSRPLETDGELELLTADTPEGLEVLRHSTSHVMAQAVRRLFPDVKLAIGPPIETGFYYDFDLPETLSEKDLARIEEEMRKIIEADYPFRRQVMSREEAIEYFRQRGEHYKVELLEGMDDPQPSLYSQGEFTDLCRGPHVPSTGRIKAFKLLNLAGAYWRGDSRRPMLQRVYGTAFPKASQLQDYLTMLEEAARRDHRRLGRELDLFSLQEEGPGFPFFHPKGMVLRNELENFLRQELQRRGYLEIRTPQILSAELWHRSGHWDHYKNNMYFTKIDDRDFAVKPMNCPGAMILYSRGVHSYRDLPLRYAEFGLVHRHELSGVLHGLMRVRAFTQDDAHLFVRPSQIRQEVEGIIDLVNKVYGLFGFQYHVELSTRPENAMGTLEQWEQATAALREALEATGLPYKINEGDGAFYGPKIDFHLRDSIGRTWQCGTIQLDFQMPERFDLTYVGEDGEKHRVVVIHRAILGSIERFIAILIEHFAGAFPVWLAPVQVRVIPVGDGQVEYATRVTQTLRESGIRVELDQRDEKVGYRIRDAQVQQIPYMLVVGEREAGAGHVAVRHRRLGDLGPMPLDQFMARVSREIAEKSLDPPAADRANGAVKPS